MMKFAERKVAGWKNRHINHKQVMQRLNARMKNGFTLDSEERKFYNDTLALIKLYN